jgi:uncharacterized protein (DUF305 family)
MDKLIMALLLGACAALTAYALRVSAPIRPDVSQSNAVPVTLTQPSPDATHAAPVAEQSTGSEVNQGVFDKAPQEVMDHANHGASVPNEPASTKAFRVANEVMHRGMNIDFSGDADADFVRGMIPHHQGAIDMAKIVLDHGKDPEIRKLAEGIVAAQDAEIKLMREWLAKKGK